jgi:hypothetical protein
MGSPPNRTWRLSTGEGATSFSRSLRKGWVTGIIAAPEAGYHYMNKRESPADTTVSPTLQKTKGGPARQVHVCSQSLRPKKQPYIADYNSQQRANEEPVPHPRPYWIGASSNYWAVLKEK